jgi:hypothetical protein
MGAPAKGMKAADDSMAAEALLSAFEDIAAAERRKHATVFNYWLSIRGDRHFPPIRDLDPLEISDAGPASVLLELIGGGEDADIRHLGQAIKAGIKVERIGEAPKPSLLSCIAKQLPLISNSRQALAFEDEFSADDVSIRCWVTLLPFSSTGTYVDYVYGFVTLAEGSKAESAPAPVEEASGLVGEPEVVVEENVEVQVSAEEPAEAASVEDVVEAVPAQAESLEVAPELLGEEEAQAQAVEELPEATQEPVGAAFEREEEISEEAPAEVDAPVAAERRPGFSKLLDTIASVGGFYGNVVQMDPKLPAQAAEDIEEAGEIEALEAVEAAGQVEPVEPVDPLEQADQAQQADQANQVEQVEKSNRGPEGFMQTRLSEVRSKADEARAAKLRANAALYEGLSAAYDFALDAEENAEEYLKLVEAQGLKIQLRSPMKPVVKLAFDGMCDEATISQLEAVLAWALKNDLPRGSLADRIEAEGGLGPILTGQTAVAA